MVRIMRVIVVGWVPVIVRMWMIVMARA